MSIGRFGRGWATGKKETCDETDVLGEEPELTFLSRLFSIDKVSAAR